MIDNCSILLFVVKRGLKKVPFSFFNKVINKNKINNKMNKTIFTPENITRLKPNEVFVFGSNEAGMHGGGAARVAYDRFGAEWGVGIGMTGFTYALPTKDDVLRPLPIDRIKSYMRSFIAFVINHPHKTFYLTKIGCGLANFTIEEMSGVFWEAVDGLCIDLPDGEILPKNLIIPKEFFNTRGC